MRGKCFGKGSLVVREGGLHRLGESNGWNLVSFLPSPQLSSIVAAFLCICRTTYIQSKALKPLPPLSSSLRIPHLASLQPVQNPSPQSIHPSDLPHHPSRPSDPVAIPIAHTRPRWLDVGPAKQPCCPHLWATSSRQGLGARLVPGSARRCRTGPALRLPWPGGWSQAFQAYLPWRWRWRWRGWRMPWLRHRQSWAAVGDVPLSRLPRGSCVDWPGDP